MMQMEKQKEKAGRGRGSSFHMSLKPNANARLPNAINQGLHVKCANSSPAPANRATWVSWVSIHSWCVGAPLA